MRTTPREVCFDLIKKSFKLSKIQRSVLIGTLLGDGALKYRGNNCRLHIKHSFNQLSFVKYKRQVFDNISSMNVRVFKQTVGKSDYSFAEFVTLTHPVFTRYYQMFYPSSKKIVPKNIDQLLTTPLSLAVWFMDDGAAENAGATLQTHSFTIKEVIRLMSLIKCNFGIKTTKKLNKNKWIIYFPKASMPKLKDIISTYMLEEFRYKLAPYSTR